MNKAENTSKAINEISLCGEFKFFIAFWPMDRRFLAQDWLKTLDDAQLLHIEEGALSLVDSRQPKTISRIQGQDLATLTLLLVKAESKNKISREEVVDGLDIYLAGLTCGACIERLVRRGWLTRTAKMGLYVEREYPTRITEKGRTEGVWAPERRVVALLGLSKMEH